MKPFWTGMTGTRVIRVPSMWFVLILLASCLSPVLAAVLDTTVADVTTRAFSVVWVSNEPVSQAMVRVFDAPTGGTELTAQLTVTLVSQQFPPALTQGIVKVSVTGLSADTRVFFQTETIGASGTVRFPPVPPFSEVRTAVKTTRAMANNTPIINDLVLHRMSTQGTANAAGTLLMVRAPHLAAAPLTAFAGERVPLPFAVVDLNNFFAAVTRESVAVPASELLEITEWRGLSCGGLADHKLVSFRRAAAHEEIPPMTELETAQPCFFADTVCDDHVNTLDIQRVFDVFNAVAPACAFHHDLDVVQDGVINILDVQRVLNRFGDNAPFVP